IEDARPGPKVAREARAVCRLIVEPAGFLTGGERRREAHAGFENLDLIGHVAKCGFRVLRQLLERARRRIVLPYQSARRQYVPAPLLDTVPEAFNPQGRDLSDQHLAVPVEHETREQIRLAEHQPIVRLTGEALAQPERRAQTLRNQRAIEVRVAIAPK